MSSPVTEALSAAELEERLGELRVCPKRCAAWIRELHRTSWDKATIVKFLQVREGIVDNALAMKDPSTIAQDMLFIPPSKWFIAAAQQFKLAEDFKANHEAHAKERKKTKRARKKEEKKKVEKVRLEEDRNEQTSKEEKTDKTSFKKDRSVEDNNKGIPKGKGSDKTGVKTSPKTYDMSDRFLRGGTSLTISHRGPCVGVLDVDEINHSTPHHETLEGAITKANLDPLEHARKPKRAPIVQQQTPRSAQTSNTYRGVSENADTNQGNMKYNYDSEIEEIDADTFAASRRNFKMPNSPQHGSRSLVSRLGASNHHPSANYASSLKQIESRYSEPHHEGDEFLKTYGSPRQMRTSPLASVEHKPGDDQISGKRKAVKGADEAEQGRRKKKKKSNVHDNVTFSINTDEFPLPGQPRSLYPLLPGRVHKDFKDGTTSDAQMTENQAKNQRLMISQQPPNSLANQPQNTNSGGPHDQKSHIMEELIANAIRKLRNNEDSEYPIITCFGYHTASEGENDSDKEQIDQLVSDDLDDQDKPAVVHWGPNTSKGNSKKSDKPLGKMTEKKSFGK